MEKVFEKLQINVADNHNISVIEGIALACELNANHRGKEVKKRENAVYEHRFDFDDPSILVDMGKRNARNNNGVNFSRAKGEIKDSCLVFTPVIHGDGICNPQAVFNGLDLAAKDFNKISFRIKREVDDKTDLSRPVYEVAHVLFKTSTSSTYTSDKTVSVKVSGISEKNDWFDVEVDCINTPTWKDYITSIRFDAPYMDGTYYVDYIVLSKSEKSPEDAFGKYIDYAVDNSIVKKDRYVTDDYNNEITVAEFCDLVGAALPEECFEAINDVCGVPGICKKNKNSAVYFMLYRAGVIGEDFAPDDLVSVCKAQSLLERATTPSERVRNTSSGNWEEDKYDLEFDNDEKFSVLNDECVLNNGRLVVEYKDDWNEDSPVHTPKVLYKNVNFKASDYVRLRVRFKSECKNENTKIGLYFIREGQSDFSDAMYMEGDYSKNGYVDPAGWCIAEIDFGYYHEWKGTIIGLRFDPVYSCGKFTIDYVRFIKQDKYFNLSHEELLALGYKSNGMLQDTAFERGFHVQHFEQHTISMDERLWQYTDTKERPLWDIGPWWNLYDLWEHRVEGDKYTLTDDKGINTIIYNPEDSSISMRVNATKIYEGKPHDVNTYRWWPHLLLNQSYRKYPVSEEQKKLNNAASDRIFLELDMRVPDFKDTINKEGANSCAFLLYFYFITDRAPSEKIWYGFHLINDWSAGPHIKPVWAPDSAAHQYMYGIPQATVFGSMEESFIPERGRFLVGNEWKHVRVDITSHIERCIELANRDKAYGFKISKEDMYFSGCNIGFEIHGNYDITVDFKNLDMVAYNKEK